MSSQFQFTGSYSPNVQRDHEGHLLQGSFAPDVCPACTDLMTAHAAHTRKQGSFSEGSQGIPRDEEGHVSRGSFGDTDCPVCQAEASNVK